MRIYIPWKSSLVPMAFKKNQCYLYNFNNRTKQITHVYVYCIYNFRSLGEKQQEIIK